MEQRNAVPQGTARPRPPRTAEERQRDRRLALSLLTRLAAAAAALTVLLGVVLLVTQAEGQDMFPAVKDGDLLIAYRLQRRWAQDDLVLYRQEGVLRLGRVAAVGGDVVMLEEDGTLRVNGTLHAGEVLYPTYPAGGVTYPYTCLLYTSASPRSTSTSRPVPMASRASTSASRRAPRGRSATSPSSSARPA